MEVEMRQPRSSQVHVSQAVSRASSLTWTMTGDPDINKVMLWYGQGPFLEISLCLKDLKKIPPNILKQTGQQRPFFCSHTIPLSLLLNS